MFTVIVELRGEILASESYTRLELEALCAKYPQGTIYATNDSGESWSVLNRGSPVAISRFGGRPRLFGCPKGSLPEIVRLAAMFCN